MRVAIMQPYFLPYIGYFQLMGQVDCFVVYDNIKYTKKGWINRNRLLRNGEPVTFSLPLAAGSDALDIRDRHLAQDFNRRKLLAQLTEAYRLAPQFPALKAWLEELVLFDENRLFDYLLHSLRQVHSRLALSCELRVSSSVDADHELRGQERVLAICKALGATTYINPTGGVELYEPAAFAAQGIELKFLKSTLPTYPQGPHPHVPALSIIDVLAFNDLPTIQDMLNRGFVFH
ncbi:WbqC family protein [Pelomonas sp. APW6]|uniref:WbqC family protein n=1 Tax=Roseateles subflavus TaxID=3053353 RepID=A0ABT7LJ56_9BURK|nr:WbqC family protein [Pelomonas sp. APW6]MDL5032864.1 WbqC family protein [Pelomonas sp. APW6]